MPTMMIYLYVRANSDAGTTVLTWVSANSYSFHGNGSGQRPSGQASVDLLSASLHDSLAEEVHTRIILLFTSPL